MSKERSVGHEGVGTRHTPGPWICDIRTGMIAVYAGPPRNCLVGTGSFLHSSTIPPKDDGWAEPTAEQVANARLIAAAPALLEAVEELLAERAPDGCHEYMNETFGIQLGRDARDLALKP